MPATKKKQGGIQHWPSDFFSARCEAKCRKTGAPCPHVCDSQIPSTIAAHPISDKDFFSLHGRPVRLCRGHYRSWQSRKKRLLTLPLLHGGHLSPYNKFGFGSVVISADRIGFEKEHPKIKIPPAWGWIGWQGNVPEGLLDRVPQYIFHVEKCG